MKPADGILGASFVLAAELMVFLAGAAALRLKEKLDLSSFAALGVSVLVTVVALGGAAAPKVNPPLVAAPPLLGVVLLLLAPNENP